MRDRFKCVSNGYLNHLMIRWHIVELLLWGCTAHKQLNVSVICRNTKCQKCILDVGLRKLQSVKVIPVENVAQHCNPTATKEGI